MTKINTTTTRRATMTDWRRGYSAAQAGRRANLFATREYTAGYRAGLISPSPALLPTRLWRRWLKAAF